MTANNLRKSLKAFRLKAGLFVCVANAGRSQMAEAFAKILGKGHIIAASGGTHPAPEIHPVVLEAMLELGTDISHKTPCRITISELEKADQVIVMGCSAEGFCPAPLLKKVIDWELEDPKGQPIEKVRKIRDEIKKRVQQLIDEISESN